MRINDLNEILEKYDFYESIIDEVCLYDNFNIKMKVYYLLIRYVIPTSLIYSK